MSEQPLDDNPEAHVDLTGPDFLDAKGWELWLSMPAWTIEEFSCLMHGIDPDEAERTIGIFSPVRRIGNNNVADMLRLLKRSETIEEISNTMEPIKFIKWAMDRGFDIPNEMKSIFDKRFELSPTKMSEDELAPKRAISLYNVIYALASSRKYTHGERSELPGKLKKMLDAEGISATKAETIKKVLEEAFRRAEEQKASR